MKTFKEFLKECNEEMPQGEVNALWFEERGLPMIVSCTCCGATMALPSAMIDDDDYIYCRDCAGV